ncbi:Ras family protein [Trichomonas vaginalis G3]|uniref:Ras family protein n=1 Tax=Trichomonas vaginalis (strain ATCC PRA-98 / G3) TaxID=412133 RepID=A2G8R9_TRIV3|nr:GTPase protein [Trichomonas vaginalis G3]EAX86445.1 Ras family protein [Trichomonas vaginalis G3]KAI5506676.1 GTPase protein [Trichomonas vaginalis G3]|eukprot:XP_001299375.1 Ras family protein [Trichomonas vaginalis G3]
MENQRKYKICLFGDSGVGKTAIVKKWLHLSYTSEQAQPTLGAGCSETDIFIDGQQRHIQVWDTAGEEKYRSMVPIYIRGAVGILLVFSLTDRSSFESVPEWIKAADTDSRPTILLVGNKSDLTAQRAVDYNEIIEFAAQRNIDYIETSAHTGANIDDAFIALLSQVIPKVTEPAQQTTTVLTETKGGGFCDMENVRCSIISLLDGLLSSEILAVKTILILVTW